MVYPYHFVQLDTVQEDRRRQLLDGYGQFAQLSILLLPLVYQLSLGISLLLERFRRLKNIDRSKEHQSPAPSRTTFREALLPRFTWKKFQWFLNTEVAPGWGTRKEWIVACLWTVWLIVLVVKDTGDDYLHVTKRFGIIAASQLPIHYLLAAKSWSPVQWLTRMSHEELNPYHRLLGRIIVLFMAIHAGLYLNFYVQKDLLSKRIRDWDVILGLLAVSSALVLSTTALAQIRSYNYRLFFYVHVMMSASLLPILFLHVKHLRWYIVEAAAVYALLVLQRNISQSSTHASVALLPETDLVSISVPMDKKFNSQTYRPGQHVYLALPSLPQKLRLNPFTIANLPAREHEIQLVARVLSGTTALLSDFAARSQPTKLLIEGPYGAAEFFPNFAKFQRILFVAGGVGATFIMPIYRNLLQQSKQNGDSPRLRFVWAVSSLADASWGIRTLKQEHKSLPDSFQLYLTRNQSMEISTKRSATRPAVINDTGEDDEIELGERSELLRGDSMDDAPSESNKIQDVKQSRPHLPSIVDEVFSHNSAEKVAVLVCGPSGMGKSLRKEVGRWVYRGRDVFWHNEDFGW